MINLLRVGYSKLFKNLAYRISLLLMAFLTMFLAAVAAVWHPADSGPLTGV